MKRILLCLLFVSVLSAQKETITVGGGGGGSYSNSAELAADLSDETGTAGSVVFSETPTITTPVIGPFIVANLPAAGTANRIAIVTDGDAAGDCTTGGGSTRVLCSDTGAAWAAIGDGNSGASPTFADILAGTNTAALVVGTGGTLTTSGTGSITATLGDSATGFFTTGFIEAGRGGTGANFASSTGMFRVASGVFSADGAFSHLAGTASDAQIPDTITINLAATATALAADPADCAATLFADSINASGDLGCSAIVDADVPDTITVSNYLPLAGGTLTGNVALDDGVGDTPTLAFTPQTGTAFVLSVEDTGDDFQFTANTSSTENVDFINLGTGVMDVLIETSDGVLTSLKSTAHITTGTFADALIAASNVTQHEAALTITESQISDLQSYLLNVDEDATPTFDTDLGITDGTGDTPDIKFTPQTGSVWDILVTDADDDFQISTTTASTENVDIINLGAGVANLTVDGTITAGTTFSGPGVTSGANPGHTHTGTSISGLDISDDTNLSATSPVTLTDDDLGIGGDSITLTHVDETSAFAFSALGNTTWGTSAIDASGATSLEIPNGASPTTDAFGEIAGDNNAWAASRGAPQWFDGTANVYLVGALVSDMPNDGEVLTFNSGGTIDWQPGGGSGDAIQVEDGDDTGTFTDADTTARFEDSGDINFVHSDGGAGGPDDIAATIRANVVGPDELINALNLGGETSLEIPNGAAPTVDAFGEIAGDNDLWAASRGAPVFFDGTAATALVNVLVSDTPSNGQVPKWNTGGTITWEDDTSGGSPAWDTISVPGGNQTLAMDVDTTTFDWTTTGDALLDAWTMTHTNTSGTDTTVQTLLRLQALNNAAAGSLNRFIEIDHADGGTADAGILISETGAGTITAGVSLTGTITTAIDASDAGIGTALAIGANDITTSGGTITQAELDILQDGLISLATEVTGSLTLAGDVSGAHGANTVDDVQDATANTEAADNSTTQVATTAFVQQEINGAGGTNLTCSGGVCNVDALVLADLPVGTANQLLKTNAGATAQEHATLAAEGGGEISVTFGVGTITLDVVEANLDLSAIGGAVTDGQVPNNITIDLATTATTSNNLAADGLDAMTEIATGIKLRADDTDTRLLTTSLSIPGANRCLEVDTNGSVVVASDTCANLGPGGTTTIDALGDSAGAGTVAVNDDAQIWNWDSPATAVAKDAFTLNYTLDAATDATTQRLLRLVRPEAANTGTLEALLSLENLDTAATVAAGIEIRSAAGGITTAIDANDAQITTILATANTAITDADLQVIDNSVIDDTEMQNEDFGDFTCTGAEDGCTLDTDSVAVNEIDQTISPDWTGNHEFFPAVNIDEVVPYSTGSFTIDVGHVFRPSSVDTITNSTYANVVSILDMSLDDVSSKEHQGFYSYVKTGTAAQTGSIPVGYDFLVDLATDFSHNQAYGIRGNMNNNSGTDSAGNHAALHAIISAQSAGANLVAYGFYAAGTTAGGRIREGLHVQGFEDYGIHVSDTNIGTGTAALYLEQAPFLFQGQTAPGTPAASHIFIYPKTGSPDILCWKDDLGTEVCLDEVSLETLLDLEDLSGAVTDGQVPNNITIDLATTATTANNLAADGLDAMSEIAAGIKRGPDATDTHLLTTDESIPAGVRCLQMDTDGSVVLATDTCANLGPGGTTTIDALGDAGGDGTVVVAEFEQTWQWNTAATATATDALTLEFTNDATTDAVTQGMLALEAPDGGNDAADAIEYALRIENLDTNDPFDAGVLIQAAAGGITTAIDASDAEIGTALAIGANDITTSGGTITQAELDILQDGLISLSSETTGTLDQSNMDTNVVMDNEGNTWSTGVQSFAAATSLTVPVAAGAAPTANGVIAFDSSANDLEYGDNGTNRIVANLNEAQTFTAAKTFSGSTLVVGATGWGSATHAHAAANSGGQIAFSNLTGTVGDTQIAAGAVDGGAGGEIADGSIVPVDTSNALRDKVCVWNLPDPVTGDDGDFHCSFESACTLQKVWCSQLGGTDVTINLYERAENVAYTGNTTDMITTDPVCVAGGDTETIFTDAAVAATSILALGIQGVTGGVTHLVVKAVCRLD